MMTLFNPHREMLRWSRDFDDLLHSPGTNGHTGFAPAVDIEEEDERFVLRADVPGVDEKAIEITVEDGVLTLSGSRESERAEERDGRHLTERHHGAFRRSFRLGPLVASDRIEASYEHGVLTVVLPKSEKAKPRQIPVKAS